MPVELYSIIITDTKSILVSLTRIRSRGPVNTKDKYRANQEQTYRFAVFDVIIDALVPNV